eukprot:Ihof_evm3s187 gene=Ihof_evmTU3s187
MAHLQDPSNQEIPQNFVKTMTRSTSGGTAEPSQTAASTKLSEDQVIYSNSSRTEEDVKGTSADAGWESNVKRKNNMKYQGEKNDGINAQAKDGTGLADRTSTNDDMHRPRDNNKLRAIATTRFGRVGVSNNNTGNYRGTFQSSSRPNPETAIKNGSDHSDCVSDTVDSRPRSPTVPTPSFTSPNSQSHRHSQGQGPRRNQQYPNQSYNRKPAMGANGTPSPGYQGTPSQSHVTALKPQSSSGIVLVPIETTPPVPVTEPNTVRAQPITGNPWARGPPPLGPVVSSTPSFTASPLLTTTSSTVSSTMPTRTFTSTNNPSASTISTSVVVPNKAIETKGLSGSEAGHTNDTTLNQTGDSIVKGRDKTNSRETGDRTRGNPKRKSNDDKIAEKEKEKLVSSETICESGDSTTVTVFVELEEVTGTQKDVHKDRLSGEGKKRVGSQGKRTSVNGVNKSGKGEGEAKPQENQMVVASPSLVEDQSGVNAALSSADQRIGKDVKDKQKQPLVQKGGQESAIGRRRPATGKRKQEKGEKYKESSHGVEKEKEKEKKSSIVSERQGKSDVGVVSSVVEDTNSVIEIAVSEISLEDVSEKPLTGNVDSQDVAAVSSAQKAGEVEGEKERDKQGGKKSQKNRKRKGKAVDSSIVSQEPTVVTDIVSTTTTTAATATATATAATATASGKVGEEMVVSKEKSEETTEKHIGKNIKASKGEKEEQTSKKDSKVTAVTGAKKKKKRIVYLPSERVVLPGVGTGQQIPFMQFGKVSRELTTSLGILHTPDPLTTTSTASHLIESVESSQSTQLSLPCDPTHNSPVYSQPIGSDIQELPAPYMDYQGQQSEPIESSTGTAASQPEKSGGINPSTNTENQNPSQALNKPFKEFVPTAHLIRPVLTSQQPPMRGNGENDFLPPGTVPSPQYPSPATAGPSMMLPHGPPLHPPLSMTMSLPHPMHVPYPYGTSPGPQRHGSLPSTQIAEDANKPASMEKQMPVSMAMGGNMSQYEGRIPVARHAQAANRQEGRVPYIFPYMGGPGCGDVTGLPENAYYYVPNPGLAPYGYAPMYGHEQELYYDNNYQLNYVRPTAPATRDGARQKYTSAPVVATPAPVPIASPSGGSAERVAQSPPFPTSPQAPIKSGLAIHAHARAFHPQSPQSETATSENSPESTNPPAPTPTVTTATTGKVATGGPNISAPEFHPQTSTVQSATTVDPNLPPSDSTAPASVTATPTATGGFPIREFHPAAREFHPQNPSALAIGGPGSRSGSLGHGQAQQQLLQQAIQPGMHNPYFPAQHFYPGGMVYGAMHPSYTAYRPYVGPGGVYNGLGHQDMYEGPGSGYPKYYAQSQGHMPMPGGPPYSQGGRSAGHKQNGKGNPPEGYKSAQ